MSIDDLFAEAERQLNICNSCRYCAGYCPVWPALELRTELGREDITHLANLCHDCQDCFTACMYTAPHEFQLNPPQIFTAVREDTYQRYVWPERPVPFLRGRRGVAIAFAVALVLVVVLGLLTGTPSAPSGSPYGFLPHVLLLILTLAPAVFTVVVMARAAVRYWRDIDGTVSGLADGRAWGRTFRQAATLKHQTGGDEGCSYPDGEPSGARRRFHHLVAYGFLLTFVSTISAWVSETFFGALPPYPVLSVPVLTGAVGGVAASIGCIGLIVLKRRSSRTETTETMRQADYALLWALLALMVTGLGTLLTRTTPAFTPFLAVHLASVLTAFAITPYTKFFHWVYRVLSIQHDNIESSRRASA